MSCFFGTDLLYDFGVPSGAFFCKWHHMDF